MMKKCWLGLILVLGLLAAGGGAAGAAEYSDVKAGDWFYAYVSDLSAAGVIDGYPDGSFRPYGQVSYGEALKLVL